MPSNLFYTQTYTNVISPIDYQLNDFSAPTTDYKNLPIELKNQIKNNVLVSYFSSDVEFYLKKPDYVVPFSMDGRGTDQISFNSSEGLVDRYSGATILTEHPKKSYYLTADSFSTSKLKGSQLEFYQLLTQNCSKEYSSYNLIIWKC